MGSTPYLLPQDFRVQSQHKVLKKVRFIQELFDVNPCQRKPMNARCSFLLIVGLLCTGAAATAAETTNVLERGPHSQVVQTISDAVDEQGNTVSMTNTFTQLQTGLNRWSEPEGSWIPAA